MNSYICPHCGYIYDPNIGDVDGEVSPGTPFEEISEDWVCPLCGVSKDMFKKN